MNKQEIVKLTGDNWVKVVGGSVIGINRKNIARRINWVPWTPTPPLWGVCMFAYPLKEDVDEPIEIADDIYIKAADKDIPTVITIWSP